MTDRYNSITVVLERDIRDDDAEPILSAIRMIKGVQSATGNVAEVSDYIAEQRAIRELGQKILNVIYPPSDET
jgi:hypothetical protein